MTIFSAIVLSALFANLAWADQPLSPGFLRRCEEKAQALKASGVVSFFAPEVTQEARCHLVLDDFELSKGPYIVGTTDFDTQMTRQVDHLQGTMEGLSLERFERPTVSNPQLTPRLNAALAKLATWLKSHGLSSKAVMVPKTFELIQLSDPSNFSHRTVKYVANIAPKVFQFFEIPQSVEWNVQDVIRLKEELSLIHGALDLGQDNPERKRLKPLDRAFVDTLVVSLENLRNRLSLLQLEVDTVGLEEMTPPHGSSTPQVSAPDASAAEDPPSEVQQGGFFSHSQNRSTE